MATYFGQDIDIAEFFEDGTLETGLSEVDTGGFLTISDSEQYHDGSASMEVNWNTLNAVSYVEAAIANDVFRFTVWYRTLTNLGEYSYGPKIVDIYCPGYGDPVYVDDWYSDTRCMRLTVGGTAQTFAVTAGAWYCIRGRFTRNGTSYLQLLNASQEEVGVVSAAVVNYQPSVIRFGETTGTTSHTGSKAYFDSLGIDIGDASAYLDGWAAAGGEALAGSVSSTSTVSTVPLYRYRTLVNNTVSGVSSTGTPFLYRFKLFSANTVAAISTLFGNLTVTAQNVIESLTGAVSAVSTVTANFFRYRFGSAAVSAASTVWGNLTTTASNIIETLTGAVTAVASTTGNFFRLRFGSGAITASASTVGNFFRYRFPAAVVSAAATTWANLTEIGAAAAKRFRIYMRIGRGRF